jgi:hypothetical protein
MTIADALALLALILGAIDVVRSKGQALTSWAVCVLAIAVLWHLVPT